MSTPDPRAVFAALHNPAVRRAYAEVILGKAPGAELSRSERQRVLRALGASGLAHQGVDGWVATDVFGELLRAAATAARPADVTRFLSADGRIDRYPARAGERRELLAHIADRAITPDEDIPEAELNGRLERFTDDVPRLRRHLVDHELLERTADGSSYRRVTAD